MSADTLAQGSINSFPGLSTGQVQPEEQIFVLSSSQLQAIIRQAQAPLLERLESLEARLAALERGVGCWEGGEERLQDLKERMESLEELRPWTEALSKKVARLEAPRISQKTEARAEKIAKYLKDRPDHKATFETLRGHLGIDKRRLLEVIKLLMATEPGRYGITRLPGDKRGRALILLPK